MLGRLDADASVLRDRLQVLNRQMTTGRRTEAAGDIAPALPRTQALRAEMSRRDAYGEAIGQALDRAGAAQTTLKRLGEIAREFADDVAMKLDPRDAQSLPLYASRARQAMVEVGRLLNAQQGGEYLFGGSDFANPPVPDPEGLPSGGMASGIAAAIAGLGGGTAAAVAAATKAAAESDAPGVTPFSAFAAGPGLGEPRRSVPAGDGVLEAYGLFANRNAQAVSQGPETTGSWARDLLRGLASISALTPDSAADPADFRALADSIRGGLESASGALAEEQGALGLTEARLTAARDRNGQMRDALQGQLAGLEEVDLAQTITRLQSTRSVLEASYTAIGRIGGLSLTQFLR